MSQFLIALVSGGGAAAASGMAAIVHTAYQRGKAAGRAEVTLETLKQAQAQATRTLSDMAERVARLEHNPPAIRTRRRKAREK
jgi:hypothetical protein